MKYLAFSGSKYYPHGGAEDLVDAYSSIEDAIVSVKAKLFEEYNETGWDGEEEYWQYQQKFSWAHIYDTEIKKIIWTLENEDKNPNS